MATERLTLRPAGGTKTTLIRRDAKALDVHQST